MTEASSIGAEVMASSHMSRIRCPTDAMPRTPRPSIASLLQAPLGTPFRPSVLRPTMPSADFYWAVRVDYSTLSQFLWHARSQGTQQTSRGKTRNCRCKYAEFIKHIPMADGELRGHVPARSRCTTPHIRFLFIASHLRWASFRPHFAVTPLPFR